jgi:hypothetical protein
VRPLPATSGPSETTAAYRTPFSKYGTPYNLLKKPGTHAINAGLPESDMVIYPREKIGIKKN